MMLVSALLASGCYGEEEVQYGGGVAGPGELVEISPGVEVVADYNLPIFFADDYYWWFDGGIWYQSTWYGGGWRRAGNVPPRVVGIGHREQYSHYRPAGWAPRGTPQARGGGAPGRGGGGFRSRPAPRGGGGGRHR